MSHPRKARTTSTTRPPQKSTIIRKPKIQLPEPVPHIIGPHPSVAEWWLDIEPPIMPELPIALSICSCIASHRA